eukprot:CAMPEP_0168748386 /NCGR_PEP_ID=MMETSP0724-20121128/16148_1 /TAXON_ID=265536 /ORGANISM="Amphiprora sp., Strain CCMP467" /LENGTH=75 /DNA_ID=CAMNT_0008796211 /DNA_START=165 /DNA_END=392 /DNA_ORIENTATION=+
MTTTVVHALGFSSLLGLVAARRKTAATVFRRQCQIAQRRGLLAADGRRWTLDELNEQQPQNNHHKMRRVFAGQRR